MHTAEFNGINSFVVGAANLLLEKAVKRETRGSACWELSEPFCIKITDPTNRWITIPERKWNVVLPYAESLWIASGRNNLSFIANYLKKLTDYSDDGIFMRGAYGPRLRTYAGNTNDYKNDIPFKTQPPHNFPGEVDQFQYIEDVFKDDINTRRAIIIITDPVKDFFDDNGNLKQTLDFPCTTLMHFIKNIKTNKLDLIVHMRSNDFLWGASAVNIFVFTFIQEYFAQILNLEIGCYQHIVNNFHYYDKFRDKIIELANIKTLNDSGFRYTKNFQSLSEFDKNIKKLSDLESKFSSQTNLSLMDFGDDFFNDWAKVLYSYRSKNKVKYTNPILNYLFK